MKTIKQYMSENKDQVIDIINDKINFTNVSLKSISEILVKCDDEFSKALSVCVSDKWNSVEDNAFKSVLSQVSVIMITDSIKNSDGEAILDKIRKAGSLTITKKY